MNQWECLEQLLLCNQFELLNYDSIQNEKKAAECRLVYLMNDAVESFLVFKNVRFTGRYFTDYDGDLEYVIDEQECFLRLKQGENVFMLFFDELKLETHLYRYGELGHFWEKGYENIRCMEYQISIIDDKKEYLGEATCNALEQKIACLKRFPPLNYVCYPSVKKQYIVPMEDPWNPSVKAMEVFLQLCKEAGDQKMASLTKQYAKCPTKRMAKKIARYLSYQRHKAVVDKLYAWICQASLEYPNRDFGESSQIERMKKLEKAQELQKRYRQKGVEVRIYREEPFQYAKDGILDQVYVMILKDGFVKRKVKVVNITL